MFVTATAIPRTTHVPTRRLGAKAQGHGWLNSTAYAVRATNPPEESHGAHEHVGHDDAGRELHLRPQTMRGEKTL